jgi:hypothetical protein
MTNAALRSSPPRGVAQASLRPRRAVARRRRQWRRRKCAGPAVVAALIRSRHPNMPSGAVAAALQNTAMPLACPVGDQRCSGGGHTSFYGNGLVDALAAARD